MSKFIGNFKPKYKIGDLVKVDGKVVEIVCLYDYGYITTGNDLVWNSYMLTEYDGYVFGIKKNDTYGHFRNEDYTEEVRELIDYN